MRREGDGTQIPLLLRLPKLQWQGVDPALPGCVRPPDVQNLPPLTSPAEGQAPDATSCTGSCALARSAACQPTSDTALGATSEPARHTARQGPHPISGLATRSPGHNAPCGTAGEPARYTTRPPTSALGAASAAEKEA